MEDCFKYTIIKDKNGRKGIFQAKEKVYRKAWFHRSLARWNPSEYGEEGQNFFANLFDDPTVQFMSFQVYDPKYRGIYTLEREAFEKFYSTHRNIKDVIFNSTRFLFPLKICQKKEIEMEEKSY